MKSGRSPKRCIICGKEFIPKSGAQKTCGPICSKKNTKRNVQRNNRKKLRKEPPKEKVPWQWMGKYYPECTSKSQQRKILNTLGTQTIEGTFPWDDPLSGYKAPKTSEYID